MSVAITDPLVLPNGQTVKNRLAKAAMTEGLADPAGRPSAELIALYSRWSAGGIGLMLTGNVQVERHHLERAGNVTIDGDLDGAMRTQLAEWVKAGKSGGSAMWAQLSHAGRQTQLAVNASPKAPSAVPMPKNAVMKFGVPVAMTEADIGDVAARFVHAAGVAHACGFDGVQVHAAHGYLLSSFLSPLANRRTDAWGGSLERRARLRRRRPRRNADKNTACLTARIGLLQISRILHRVQAPQSWPVDHGTKFFPEKMKMGLLEQ